MDDQNIYSLNKNIVVARKTDVIIASDVIDDIYSNTFNHSVLDFIKKSMYNTT